MIEVRCLEHLSTTDLIQEVKQEIQHYVHGRATMNTSAFELFRRALKLRDEQAWEGLYQLYSNLVSSWILHLVAEAQLTQDDLVALINATFAKFAQSISAQKFANFSSLERLLVYFKLCAQSVVRDEMRIRRPRQRHELTMDAIEDEPLMDDPANVVLEKLEASEVWQIICRSVRPDERLILLHNCVLDCPARELQQCYPTVFASVDEVYRIRRNVIERLKRNRQLRAWLAAGRLIA